MNRKVGWFLVIINLLLAANAAFFFLAVKKLSVPQWLAVNSCTPSILLFALGFFLRSPSLLGFSAAGLVFYGGGGLLVFRWSLTPQDLIPQIGHIFMTAASVYVFISTIRAGAWKSCGLGLLLGALVLALIVFPRQRQYQKSHPELVEILGFRPDFAPR